MEANWLEYGQMGSGQDGYEDSISSHQTRFKGGINCYLPEGIETTIKLTYKGCIICLDMF